jgi:hypothetical protein
MTETLVQPSIEFKVISRPVPDFAITEKRWHTMRSADFHALMYAAFMALPKVQFDGLKEGMKYLFKSSSASKGIFVKRITPTGKQVIADVMHPSHLATDVRLSKGDCYGDFHILTDELLAMLGVSHEAIVWEAKERGLTSEIPALVRCDHVHLFIEVPEFFDFKKHGQNQTGLQRLEGLVWQMKAEAPMNVLRLETMIEGIQASIAFYRDAFTKAIARIPANRFDYGVYIGQYEEEIEFYRWCQPLFAPGGFLYVPGSEDFVPEGPRQSPFSPPIKYASVLPIGDLAVK